MQFGQSETQKRGKKNGLSDGKKCMLIFRRLYTGLRYFMPSAKSGKTIQTETDKKP